MGEHGAGLADGAGTADGGTPPTLVFQPNQVTMGHSAWSKISGHPKLINAVKGGLTTEGMITRQQFADLFELQRVNIGTAYMDAARFGQNPNLQRVWGNHMIFQFVNPSADVAAGTITHGFTASMMRAVSPPEAIRPNGFSASPAFGAIMNATSSIPLSSTRTRRPSERGTPFGSSCWAT